MSDVSMIDGHIDETKLKEEDIVKALEKAISHHEIVANKDWSLTLSKETTIALLDFIKRKDEKINGLIAGQETLQKHLAEKMQRLID